MLTHLRLTVPADLTDAVVSEVAAHGHVTNVVELRGAVIDPPGDLIELDVPREAVTSVLDVLDHFSLDERGAIVISDIAAAPFRRARQLADDAAGEADDAVVWDTVVEQVESGSQLSWTFQAFLILAAALAAVAVITDSPILVVGAMVISPDFQPVATMALGVAFRRWHLARRGARQMILGYVVAIAVVAVFSLVGRWFGVIHPVDITGPRPLTNFIWQPNLWSLVVAVLAGAAGALALTASKSTILVGVFISVTTIPSAGNLAVALAVQDWEQAWGSAEQLIVNIVGMLVAGIAVLLVQKNLAHPPRDLFPHHHHHHLH